MIAAELGITPIARRNDLVAELGLRETTRSGRFRAWGILEFPLSDCDVQTGRARRGNARLGARMTQQLRST